ncbi:MAG: SDR family NAD(P)-dependent oxidoreductase [Acidimicrobiia bacterium]
MDLALTGKVALVTGGSQGIGRAIALTLAAEGADLTLCARRAGPLVDAAGAVAALGRAAETVTADVATPDGAASALATTLDRFGRIDILVNNAGKGSPKPLLELTDDDWYRSLELNLMSAVRLSLASVPHMRTAGGGRIVNISSRVAREPDAYFAPYAAAKAALINFTKSLANAVAPDGILANCVVPGLIRGEGVQEAAERSAAATGMTVEEVYTDTLRKRPIPAGRLGEPEDVAGLVALLVSARASWITGSCFTVDGGIVRSDR